MARRVPAARAAVLGALILAAACTTERGPASTDAILDVDACFSAIAAGGDADSAACPSFLMAAASDAAALCRDAGGVVSPNEAPDIWNFDVNGDNRPEHALTTGDVAWCEGAPSAFSCGSLGCPKGLYGERDGEWRLLGSISAGSRDAITVTDTVRADGYRDLVVACGAGEDCVERWHYVWQGGAYEPVDGDVRGHRVLLAESVHGLFALAADTTVLATPTPDGATLDGYAAGTEVAIVGTTVDGSYFYVSPCNACASGFVPATLIPTARSAGTSR